MIGYPINWRIDKVAIDKRNIFFHVSPLSISERKNNAWNLGAMQHRKKEEKKSRRYPHEAVTTTSEIQATAELCVWCLRCTPKAKFLHVFRTEPWSHPVWKGVIVHQRQSSLMRPRSVYVCISAIQASPIPWCDTHRGRKLLKGYYPQSADHSTRLFFSSPDCRVF